MYISYLNFIINKPAEKVKKPQQVLDLQQVYRELADSAFPLRSRNLTINYLEMCSSSQGCAPKKSSSGTRSDFMVAMKDTTTDIRTDAANNASKNVLLNMKGTFQIGDTSANVALRVPRSGAIGVRLGMSTQSSIAVSNRNADAQIAALQADITSAVVKAIPSLLISGPTVLAGVKVSGFNMFNPHTGNRPAHPLKNFIAFMRILDRSLPDHELDYSHRNGRQVVRANFKPEAAGQDATIGITRWGMVDFLGNVSMFRVNQLAQQLSVAYTSHIEDAVFDTTVTEKPKSTGKKAQIVIVQAHKCPKSTPPASANGTCADPNRIPVPNKHGSICCKKHPANKSIPPSLATKLQANYARVGKLLPNSLQARMRTNKTNDKQPNSVPIWQHKGQKWMFQGSKFTCMTTAKQKLQDIAKSLGLNPNGTKNDLCTIIEARLKRQRQNKRNAVRSKLLQMKVKLRTK